MQHRFFNPDGLKRQFAVAVIAIAAAPVCHASGVTGGATEWTQLANNAELINLVKSSGLQVDNQLTQITQLAQQIENQTKIYQNLLQNTAQLPSHMWDDAAGELQALRSIVSQGQSIAFSMANADDVLKQRFQSYRDLQAAVGQGTDFSTGYAKWSDTNRDTIAGTLQAASLTAGQFDNEDDVMASLHTMSQSADGQLKALQVGHEIAAEQVAQLQKLRGLFAQQMTMTGTWYQSQQAEKDLATARREKFFDADVSPIPEGQKMEPRW